MECRLAGETEVLGENLPQRHFCPTQNPTLPDPGLNPGRRGGKRATNRLSYGAAMVLTNYLFAWPTGLYGITSQTISTLHVNESLIFF
jgi:hypothetical protein